VRRWGRYHRARTGDVMESADVSMVSPGVRIGRRLFAMRVRLTVLRRFRAFRCGLVVTGLRCIGVVLPGLRLLPRWACELVAAWVAVWKVPWPCSLFCCAVVIWRFRLPSFQSRQRRLFLLRGKKKGRDLRSTGLSA
jgi:hypothetical protein